MLIDIGTNGTSNAGYGGTVNIGVGAAGSEVPIIKDLVVYAPGNGYWGSNWVAPVSVPAGTRISAAVNGNAGADTYYVDVALYDGYFSSIECSGLDSMGATGGHGTLITAGAAATKGSYSQLVASTPRDYFAIAISAATKSNTGLPADRWLFDVAIGGAGSEIIIVPDMFLSTSAVSFQGSAPFMSFLPIEIPAGTRVSARVSSALGGSLIGFIVYGLYE
jgi:hypothetical protein